MTATAPKPAGPLTARQREVLAAIADLYLAAGCSRMPSYRELCERLGIGSPNGLYAHLTALERKGLIRANRRRGTGGAGTTTRCVEVVGLAAALRPAAEAFFRTLTAAPE